MFHHIGHPTKRIIPIRIREIFVEISETCHLSWTWSTVLYRFYLKVKLSNFWFSEESKIFFDLYFVLTLKIYAKTIFFIFVTIF
jgi:hypothetical protein